MGRVIKMGISDQTKLLDTIANAPTVTIGSYDWTITDIEDHRNNDMPFIFGKLSKYAKHGHVKTVDEQSRSQVDTEAPNLLVASSPFIYLPYYSGIAFLHVWNGIQEDVFPRRFKTIIEKAFDNFFVNCTIEPISDYKAFTTKLKTIDKFIELSARVHPPNPLYGRLWSSLDKYLKKRNATEVSVKETNEAGNGIKTNVVKLMDNIMDDPNYVPSEPPDITDAAILMAADGYGLGKVVGLENNVEIVIRTSDTQKSFLFAKEPVPENLAEEARKTFSKVNKERDLKH